MALKSVLIADDDRELVEVLALRCRQLGVEAVTAHDSIEALAAARGRRPDLICLDVNMPLGNGLSVCEMLAGDEDMATIPVVMLTGRSDQETIVRCHKMCAYYVLKSADVWSRLRPILCEILELEETPSESSTSAGQRPRLSPKPSTRSLSHIMAAMAREVVFAQEAESATTAESRRPKDSGEAT